VSRYSTVAGAKKGKQKPDERGKTCTLKRGLETASSGTREEETWHRGEKRVRESVRGEKEIINEGGVVLDKLRMWHACGSRYKQER